jgi:hypothetical protein
MADFPVTYESQEQFDTAIQSRLNRERDKIRKEGGGNEELESARERVATLEGEIRTRDARAVLSAMNVTEAGRQDRIMRLMSWPETADEKSLKAAFKATYDEIPEAFPEGASVKDKAVDSSGGDDSTGPLTQAQVASMSPGEINSNWDRVKAFVSGER